MVMLSVRQQTRWQAQLTTTPVVVAGRAEGRSAPRRAVRLDLSCEVSRLALDDIRWRGGSLVIHREGGRAEEFPLLADVGLALAEYLRARSPAAGTRAVFVTTVAPRRVMTGQGIGQVVRAACARAGWPAGPHQFRHLLGGTLLQAGVPLAGVAQVLGHRALAVTAGCAAPGRSQLAELIRPWPLAVSR